MLFLSFADVILSLGGQGSSWNTESCREHGQCLKFLRLSQQLVLVKQHQSLPGLGSLLQHFAETVIGRVFHPSEISDENYLVYQSMLPVESGIMGKKNLSLRM